MVIYGGLYLVLGIFFSRGFSAVIELFPKPVLGVILFFEALALMKLVRDVAAASAEFAIALLVGLIAFGLPYGYVIGLVLGTALAYLARRGRIGLSR